MRRKGILKSLFVFFLGAFITVSTPSIVASWKTGGNKEPVGASSSVAATEQNPVAYIAGSTKTYFASISKALTAASSGDIVIAIPATNKNYHSTSNAVANSSIDKKEYTITEDCEIKSGVTFVIPTDTDTINSVTSSSTLSTYINSMKEDDHSRGTGYGSFATNSEGRWLRVTVNIAAGVTLTNNGTLVVSGYQNSGTSGGGLVGGTSHSYSRILLDSNAKIVQSNSSAKTYCFGYISEKTANNNSQAIFNTGTLYIPFILDDYRGFSYTWAMTYNSNEALSTYKCAPFNQFEFRNLDCLTTIKYGCSVYGEITIYLSYPSQSIDKTFPKEINVVGTTSSFMVQLTNSTYSSLSYKFNKTTQVSKIIFYGGMTLNTLSLSISESIVTVNLSTNSSYLPISYRQNIELKKATGQSDTATFSFANQMVKLMPGSELIIDTGAKFTGKSLIVYSTFYDGGSYNGHSSACAYSQKYPLKAGGVLKVASGGNLTCTQSVAGTMYGASADFTLPSTTSITAYEAWALGGSGSINPAWKITDYLQIAETLQRLDMSAYSKKKLYVGMNTFKNYNSYKPSLQVVSDEGTETQVTTNVNQIQKVVHLDNLTTYRLEFLNNVDKAFKNATAYAKDEVITYNAASPICGVINSVTSISSNNNGINEFDVQSVTVTCSTPLVNGQIPLYPGYSVQLQANVVDIDKCYDKTITWATSNSSIATVSSTGSVTGVTLGTVRITATCDGVSGYIDLEVIEEQTIQAITSIWIRDNNGKTSQGDPTVNSSDSSFMAHAQYSNGTNVTFTVVINPTGAPYKSISWTFRASAAGRQYMNDNTISTETVTGVESVVIHIVSDSGADDDKCSLQCTVVDLYNNSFTNTFIINHKKDACITGDTMVLLANGTYARADTLHVGDLLKTWSFEKGDWVIEPIIFLQAIEEVYANIITIKFDDGSYIDISWKQGFFDADLLDYFVISDENYQSAIGRKVLAFDGDIPVKKRIVSASMESRLESVYEIHTGHGYQFVANGILTVEPLINEHVWFAVNEDYKYDEELMRQDLETYGVLPYEVFADYVTEEQYDLFNGQYLSVPIGKGYFTLEELMEIIKHFLPGNT